MVASRQVLAARSAVLQAIRRFFVERSFIEVETPVRIAAPALELHIDAEPAGSAFLRTSPELYMKRLLAAGHDRIFELGPCFRRGEKGRRHHPEYALLEWYRADADAIDILTDTKALLAFVVEQVTGGTATRWGDTCIEWMPVWETVTVRDAFMQHAGWDPLTSFDADRFDLDLVDKVEPRLPRDRPVVLKDYPVELAALARIRSANPPVAERWELYVGGMELANAFSELTDAHEQRARFEQCARDRQRAGKVVYPLDEEFLAVLEGGLPRCGGVALGVDRLVMLLTDSDSIDQVRAFSD